MKYKSKNIIIKAFPEITLVFYNEQSIYAFTKENGRPFVFHNWMAPKFTYRDHWRPFKKALMKRRHLDKQSCWQLAYDYQIPYKLATSEIDLEGKPVEIRYKKWSISGVIDGLQQ